jgi:hypothetical protein
MNRLLVPLFAAAALAVPATASAHFGFGGFAKLSGTGGTFAATSATASGTATSDKLGTGTFSLSLSNNLSAATTHTGEHGSVSCAPSTGTLTLTGATAANHATVAITSGRECTFTKTGGTVMGSILFGRGTVTGAGTLASLTGKTAKVMVFRRASDSSVRGFVHVHSTFAFDQDNDNDGD